MECLGKAIFLCDNPGLLSLIDEFLDVCTARDLNDIINLEANFIFLDKTTKDMEKICHFARSYINKNVVIFYCCPIEELEKILPIFDDYISLPCSKNQIQYKVKYWLSKRRNPLEIKTERMYIIEKIELFLSQAFLLCGGHPTLEFQLLSVEWLLKFLKIQIHQIDDNMVDKTFDFIKLFLKQFNSQISIKMDFIFRSLPVNHQRNLLQVILALSRVCAIYTKSECKIKKIDGCIYIYVDKKLDLLKEYISCILFKKIITNFKNYWQQEKLEEGTLFKYTLFEDR